MIDVKTIALKLNVSRQTIYNHIEKNNQAIESNIRKINGVTYLKTDGVDILKESLGLINPSMQKQDISMDEIIKNISKSITESIKENLEDTKTDIKKDYESLDNEVSKLKKQNEQLIELIKQQNKKQEEIENKSFFNFFKRK